MTLCSILPPISHEGSGFSGQMGMVRRYEEDESSCSILPPLCLGGFRVQGSGFRV